MTTEVPTEVIARLEQTGSDILLEIIAKGRTELPPGAFELIEGDVRRILAEREEAVRAYEAWDKERRENHHCHAVSCKVHVKPEYLMCRRHWAMVSKTTQRLVWRYYRSGQCDDMKPSRNWARAAARAIVSVASQESLVVSAGLTKAASQAFE